MKEWEKRKGGERTPEGTGKDFDGLAGFPKGGEFVDSDVEYY